MLSKSDFKVARTCPTKLYYRKKRYPSNLSDDPYLEFLADGGFMIETLAHLHFPTGREMPFGDGIQDAAFQSSAAFAEPQATLFESTFIAGRLMARIDILKRDGADVRLIEVKAKSIDTSTPLAETFCSRNGIRPEWRPYLEDVAFQTLVLRRLYPELSIVPFLCMPDKSRTTSIDLLHKHFVFEEEAAGEGAKIKRQDVRFTGDADQAVRGSFLAFVDVSEWVERLMPEVEQEADRFVNELDCGATKARPVIGTNCANCEFRVENQQPSGFAECWGEMALPAPHILDYYQVGNLGGRGAPAVQALLDQGKARFADISEDRFVNAKGEIGAIAARQLLQREYTFKGQEFRSSDLAPLLQSHAYPLHFVDFEASRIAVPYHAGMKPYEQACFQWSCHTIRTPGGALEHAEWINVEDAYPNMEFANTLSKWVGLTGTVYIWSRFEISALKEIRQKLGAVGGDNADLAIWLDAIIDADGTFGLTTVDLCEVAKHHYFHPLMKGRLSIKYVLPAVWSSNPALWTDPDFAQYHRLETDGGLLNPYDTLPPLPFGDNPGEGEETEAVKEGTGAIRAYQELLYGPSSRHPERKEAWRQALLQYCKLDTAAMVMIWKHWTQEAIP
jgi:hypothetical protein